MSHARSPRDRVAIMESGESGVPIPGMDMRRRTNNARIARARNRRILAAVACLFVCAGARAAMFRCVDANGASTYSDRPCASDEGEPGQPGAADSAGPAQPLNSP